MKRIAFYVCIVLIVVGIVARLYADQYTHVTAEGVLVESAWLPIGTLMVVVGVLALLVLGILSAISFLRDRAKQ